MRVKKILLRAVQSEQHPRLGELPSGEAYVTASVAQPPAWSSCGRVCLRQQGPLVRREQNAQC